MFLENLPPFQLKYLWDIQQRKSTIWQKYIQARARHPPYAFQNQDFSNRPFKNFGKRDLLPRNIENHWFQISVSIIKYYYFSIKTLTFFRTCIFYLLTKSSSEIPAEVFAILLMDRLQIHFLRELLLLRATSYTNNGFISFFLIKTDILDNADKRIKKIFPKNSCL